ncbi:MAG: DUF853 family protein, partial [Candidatus Micrarchaeota archaeon]|nr:DUF853 family protein [Candidatus Micrarchaeota archaeon]
LRAFTQNELEDIHYLAKSFPYSAKTDLAREILSLQIGEALVSPLDEKGRPEGPFKTMVYAPRSSMETAPKEKILAKLSSALLSKYGEKIANQSQDFSSGLERLHVSYGGKNYGETGEAARMERKQTRAVNKSWSRMMWLGIFAIIVLLLVALVSAILLYLFK